LTKSSGDGTYCEPFSRIVSSELEQPKLPQELKRVTLGIGGGYDREPSKDGEMVLVADAKQLIHLLRSVNS
jgi:hypothetical protein